MISTTYDGALTAANPFLCGDFTMPNNAASVKTTLVYWDPAGAVNADPALVNNVDLYLHAPGDVWWGNLSTVDTVEAIYLANPDPGSWQVCVNLAALNSGTSQTYAVALSVVDDAPTRDIDVPGGISLSVPADLVVDIDVTINNWSAYGSFATVTSNSSDIELHSSSQSAVVWGDLLRETQRLSPAFTAKKCGPYPDAISVAVGASNFGTYNTTVDVFIACVGDIYEEDGTLSVATTIDSGNAQTHSIMPEDDHDWVEFTLSQESAITLETSGSSGDTELRLYSSDPAQIDYDDDDGVGYFSRITRTCDGSPLAPGTYYAQVNEYGTNAVIADYQMLYSATACGSSSPKSVLFDEAHEEWRTLDWTRAQALSGIIPWNPDPEWVYYGALSSAISDTFTLERNVSTPLSLDLLGSYEALILTIPQSPLSAAEVNAVRRYVASGGGLLLIGDCGYNPPNPELPATYGIAFDPACLFEPVPDQEGAIVATNMATHPAVAGLDHFTQNWGESLQLACGTAWVIDTGGTDTWRDANYNDQYDVGEAGTFDLAAAHDTGCGRVAALSDDSFADGDLAWTGNAPAMRALLSWITDGQVCDVDYTVYLPLVVRN